MRTITIYHSPDSDDAFMFYGLTSGEISYPGYHFTHELSDIESLNQRAIKGELEVTAVSVHAYAYLQNKYAILNCGASMGGHNYGPKVVTRTDQMGRVGAVFNDTRNTTPVTIAIPGQYTSAALALKIFLHEKGISAKLVTIDFDKVQDAVKRGEVDAGVIIHEGQLTHEQEGLLTLVDLGAWWWKITGLPLPLGVNVVRKDIGEEAIAATAKVLKASIEYSLKNRDKALSYALPFGRGINKSDADVFVGMYVNDLTVDLGERGRRSIELFLTRGSELGFIPVGTTPHFVR